MKKIFYLDQRSMALGRVLLAFVVLWDILRTIPVLEIFFTDDGIVNRSKFLAYSLDFGSFSYLLINGSYSFALSLLFIAGIAAVFLMLGIRTRVSLFLCWSILVSFQERFVHLYNGGDALLLILLFWSFFLPINASTSWDQAFLDGEKNEDHKFTNFFTFAFILQVCFVYIFTALNKWHPVWHKDGTALYYVSELESYLQYFGFYLKEYPGFMKVVTKSTVWFEGLVPLLLFIPFFQGLFRFIVCLSFILFHVGIELTLDVGNFSFIAISMWSFLLPSEFWEFLKKKLSSFVPPETLTITYDKDCGFCKRMVRTICSWLLVDNVKIQSSESDPALHKKMMEVYSWAGERDEMSPVYGWETFRELLKHSLLFPVAWFLRLIPLKVGEQFYRAVSNNRAALSKVVFSVGGSKVPKEVRKITLVFGTFFLLLCLGFNVDRLEKVEVDFLGRDLENTAVFLRLSQRWGMFAPRPSTHEGWFVIQGELINGKRFDLQTGEALSFERPKNLANFYPHAFWRKFITNLEQESRLSKILRDQYGAYLCRSYNKEKPRGGKQLRFIDFYFMKEKTPEPGWPQSDAEKKRLFGFDCPLSGASKL